MDVGALATEVLTTIQPFLGRLAGGVADAAIDDVGDAAWRQAKKLWKRLRGAEKKPPEALEAAARQAAASPQDKDALEVLRLQLKVMLKVDLDLAATIQQVLAEAGPRVEVHGGRAVVAQGPGAIAAETLVVSSEHHHYHDGEPEPSLDPLRRAYLNRLLCNARQLSLSGVDPAVATAEADARLDLDAVYVGLLTTGSRQRDDVVEDDGLVPEETGLFQRVGRLNRYLPSAVAQLDHHQHLVLLGDPGSGKSTFVSFVALCLAGEALGRGDVNLGVLTTPLQRDSGDEEKVPQPWNHGELLPVRVVLRDLAARVLPEPGEPARAVHLWQYLEQELASAGHQDLLPSLKQELLERGGLVLLDGLDEVPSAHRRRTQICRMVEDFAESYPECRVVVTCRTYAYQSQDWKLAGFSEAVLAPFDEHQIETFIERWYVHWAQRRAKDTADARGRAELLKQAIRSNDRLAVLAERPLLLTLMASLHAWRSGSLPERRAQLYEESMNLLLDVWERQRMVCDGDGTPRIAQPSLLQWLDVDQTQVLGLLARLAFAAHARQPELTGTADIAEGELVAGLLGISRKGDAAVSQELLVEHLSDRAGLLVPRGVGVYTFPHRTFQEHLAACHLTDEGFPERTAELARNDPERWREVVLLAAARASTGFRDAVWLLVDHLCHREPDDPDVGPADVWGARLAGQALAEAELRSVSERYQKRLDLVRRWQQALMERQWLPAVERAGAGRSLAILGDHRDEVMTIDGMQLCLVPPGRFWMGETGVEEWPGHELDLDYPYWIGLFPVSVAQFREYVEEVRPEGIEPRVLSGAAGLPVSGVSWYQARDFCRWLSSRWAGMGLLADGWSVRLPSEAEWEKASRGGKQIPQRPIVVDAGSGRLRDAGRQANLSSNNGNQREFPWGSDFDPERANTWETGIGERTALGCFKAGASPYACEEMSGNVWEWTRSLWGKSWNEAEFSYPYESGDGREEEDAASDVLRVVRGGSFVSLGLRARCSYRYRHGPEYRYHYLGFRVVVLPSFSDL